MFIHYNTLRYRINRITELTGIDFKNARTIFLISISERILNIQDMQRVSEKNHTRGFHSAGKIKKGHASNTEICADR